MSKALDAISTTFRCSPCDIADSDANDRALYVAEVREAAKHVADVAMWAAMAGAALDNARDGEAEA